jgi:hypothetical protein
LEPANRPDELSELKTGSKRRNVEPEQTDDNSQQGYGLPWDKTSQLMTSETRQSKKKRSIEMDKFNLQNLREKFDGLQTVDTAALEELIKKTKRGNKLKMLAAFGVGGTVGAVGTGMVAFWLFKLLVGLRYINIGA